MRSLAAVVGAYVADLEDASDRLGLDVGPEVGQVLLERGGDVVDVLVVRRQLGLTDMASPITLKRSMDKRSSAIAW